MKPEKKNAIIDQVKVFYDKHLHEFPEAIAALQKIEQLEIQGACDDDNSDDIIRERIPEVTIDHNRFIQFSNISL